FGQAATSCRSAYIPASWQLRFAIRRGASVNRWIDALHWPCGRNDSPTPVFFHRLVLVSRNFCAGYWHRPGGGAGVGLSLHVHSVDGNLSYVRRRNWRFGGPWPPEHPRFAAASCSNGLSFMWSYLGANRALAQ